MNVEMLQVKINRLIGKLHIYERFQVFKKATVILTLILLSLKLFNIVSSTTVYWIYGIWIITFTVFCMIIFFSTVHNQAKLAKVVRFSIKFLLMMHLLTAFGVFEGWRYQVLITWLFILLYGISSVAYTLVFIKVEYERRQYEEEKQTLEDGKRRSIET